MRGLPRRRRLPRGIPRRGRGRAAFAARTGLDRRRLHRFFGRLLGRLLRRLLRRFPRRLGSLTRRPDAAPPARPGRVGRRGSPAHLAGPRLRFRTAGRPGGVVHLRRALLAHLDGGAVTAARRLPGQFRQAQRARGERQPERPYEHLPPAPAARPAGTCRLPGTHRPPHAPRLPGMAASGRRPALAGVRTARFDDGIAVRRGGGGREGLQLLGRSTAPGASQGPVEVSATPVAVVHDPRSVGTM